MTHTISLEQFVATRRFCADLRETAAELGEAIEEPVPPCGYLYMGSLHITKVLDHWPEDARAEGDWHLLIGNQEWIARDLAPLEQRLYEFAISSGRDSSNAIAALTDEYQDFNRRHGLQLGSADEHTHDDSLTEEQRTWVRDFTRRWELVEHGNS
jgi:hypothetical protein